MSDKVGRGRVYFIGALGLATVAFPYFALIRTGILGFVFLGFILSVAYVAMMAVQPAFFVDLFKADVRYSGVAIGYQLGTLVGSIIPVLAAALLAAGNGEPWFVAGLLVVVGCISFVAAYFALLRNRKTGGSGEVAEGGSMPVGEVA